MDGRPNRRNKAAAFSNFSTVVWMLPKQVTRNDFFPVPRNVSRDTWWKIFDSLLKRTKTKAKDNCIYLIPFCFQF